MKKSLKALILCGLASLVMFAVIYASPITAQAATYSNFDIIDVDGNLLSGCSLTVTYGLGSGTGSRSGVLSLVNTNTQTNAAAAQIIITTSFLSNLIK